MTWIQTYSGKKLFPFNPNPEAICIEDIAHALALQCRYTGHCKWHYSVAQHSVLVSQYCPIDLALYGLLHDASEAYLCDVASPIKHDPSFSKYREVEKILQSSIYVKFGLLAEEPLDIKIADLRLRATEKRDLMVETEDKWNLPLSAFDFSIEKLYPEQAEELFIKRFEELCLVY